MSEEDKIKANKRILQGPRHKVFEHVAAEFAAVFYDVGRSQGLKSKFKDARSYARANFEKFIPRAVEHCIDLLSRQDIPDLAKAEIYDALQERINNPDINEFLPDVDIKKVMDALPKQDRIATEVKTILHNSDVPKKFNPYLKVN